MVDDNIDDWLPRFCTTAAEKKAEASDGNDGATHGPCIVVFCRYTHKPISSPRTMHNGIDESTDWNSDTDESGDVVVLDHDSEPPEECAGVVVTEMDRLRAQLHHRTSPEQQWGVRTVVLDERMTCSQLLAAVGLHDERSTGGILVSKLKGHADVPLHMFLAEEGMLPADLSQALAQEEIYAEIR